MDCFVALFRSDSPLVVGTFLVSAELATVSSKDGKATQ